MTSLALPSVGRRFGGARIRHRSEVEQHLRDEVVGSSQRTPLVVHWDEKILPFLTGKKTVDRLPVLVSGKDFPKVGESCQLLGVPRIEAGTGIAQAAAVNHLLETWHVKDRVVGMVFDSTASNTGRNAEACKLLGEKLQRNLLWLAHRHHSHEIILSSVFTSSFGSSIGPNVALFKRFQQ